MKNIKKFLFGIILSFIFIGCANASTGSISVSTSTKNAVVGSTFKVTVKVNCPDGLGSWQFGLSYDNSYISLQSNSANTSIVDYASSANEKTRTYTYTFKAIKSGTANIKISSPSMVSWTDENNLFTPSSNNLNVNIKTQKEIEASYSKDNNLKSLSIDGYELSPTFNKDILEYNVSVPDTVTSIKVNGAVNDSKASVSGLGEKELTPGSNKIEVVVTAQNGAIKTYIIMVDVKDLNPLNTTIGDQEYSIVKKSELLEAPMGYKETTITIDGIEVPAYKSEITNLTLVGLKDNSGTIKMYIYDESKKSYSPYKELKNSSLSLYPLEIENELDGFSITKIKINEEEFEVLKSKEVDNFYLIYAMNVVTGEKHYYIIDIDENNFIKYNNTYFDKLIKAKNEFKIYFLIATFVAVVLLLMTIILGANNSKLKKIILKVSNKNDSKNNEKIDF